jgi:hypothetical protein
MKKESKGGQSDKAGFPKAGFSKETAYEMKLERHKKHEKKKRPRPRKDKSTGPTVTPSGGQGNVKYPSLGPKKKWDKNPHNL